MKVKSSVSKAVLLTLLFVGVFTFTKQAEAQTIKPVTVQSSKDFDGTVSALKKAVSKGGMMVLGELNQGKVLSMTGLHVKSHSFFVGNPKVGKKAFSADSSVGLVIPPRISVYEKGGKVYVSYFKPSDLFSAYDGKSAKMMGKKLDKKMKMMTKMVAE